MTPFGWLVTAFALFMAGVCLFTYVQIERHAHQRRQVQAAARDAQEPPTP